MAAPDRMLPVSVTDFESWNSRMRRLTKLSEIALVGKAAGTYMMLLGGGYYGQRLNKIYRGQAKSPL